MNVLAIISFFVSLILISIVCFYAYGKHEYNNSHRKHGYLTYVVSGILLIAFRNKYFNKLDYIDGFHFYLCLMLMFGAINIYAIGWLREHFYRASRFRDLSNKKFKDAEMLTFEGLRLGVKKGLENVGLTKSSKIYDKGSKMVWETIMDPGEKTRDYLGDFYKNIVVFGGVIKIYYDTGEIDTLKRLDQVNIRPYEVHRVECVKKCKLIVTLIE